MIIERNLNLIYLLSVLYSKLYMMWECFASSSQHYLKSIFTVKLLKFGSNISFNIQNIHYKNSSYFDSLLFIIFWLHQTDVIFDIFCVFSVSFIILSSSAFLVEQKKLNTLAFSTSKAKQEIRKPKIHFGNVTNMT